MVDWRGARCLFAEDPAALRCKTRSCMDRKYWLLNVGNIGRGDAAFSKMWCRMQPYNFHEKAFSHPEGARTPSQRSNNHDKQEYFSVVLFVSNALQFPARLPTNGASAFE